MKKFAFFLIVLVFSFLWVAQAGAKSYETTRSAGDYQVDILIDRNPPVAYGDNQIEIVIKGKDGKVVSDAQVTVNYYMPPMPRMAPMNYKTEAKMKKGKYYATMKLIMAGPWYIAVIIRHEGKTYTAKINVDAQ